jgi:hypothetical protein
MYVITIQWMLIYIYMYMYLGINLTLNIYFAWYSAILITAVRSWLHNTTDIRWQQQLPVIRYLKVITVKIYTFYHYLLYFHPIYMHLRYNTTYISYNDLFTIYTSHYNYIPCPLDIAFFRIQITLSYLPYPHPIAIHSKKIKVRRHRPLAE